MYKGFVQVWIKIDVNLAVTFDMKLCVLNHNEELHQPWTHQLDTSDHRNSNGKI